jgi:hypothetical protein
VGYCRWHRGEYRDAAGHLKRHAPRGHWRAGSVAINWTNPEA